MKVKDLIKALKKADPEADVLISKDAEGNGFSHFEGITLDGRITEDGYDVEWADEKEIEEEHGEDPTQYPKCIVLWP